MKNLKFRLSLFATGLVLLAIALGWLGAYLTQDPSRQIGTDRLALAAFLFVGLCGFALYVLVERGLSPIVALTDTFARMQAGDLNPRLLVEGPQEMRQMAEAFNEMMSDLEIQIRNVTDEKHQAERSRQYLLEQISASERYSAMVESAPVGIVFADAELNIVYQNATSESGFVQLSSFLEWNAEVVVGRPLSILFPDEEHAREILSDPDRLPYEAHGQIGPYGVRYLAGSVYSSEGDHAGTLLMWEVDSGVEAPAEASVVDGDWGEVERAEDYPSLEAAEGGASTGGSNNGTQPEAAARLRRGASLVGRSIRLLSDQLSTITSMVEALCNEGDNLRRSLEDTRQRTRHAAYLTADRSEALWELVSEMGDLGERTRTTATVAKRLQKATEKADAVSSGVSDLADAIQHVVREARMEMGRAEGSTGGMKAVVDEIQVLGKECARLKKDVEAKLARIRQDADDVASSLDEDRREVRAGVRLSRRADHALGRVERDLTDVDERTDLLTEMAVGQSEIGAHIADQLDRLTKLVDTTARVAREHARMVEGAGGSQEAGVGVEEGA